MEFERGDGLGSQILEEQLKYQTFATNVLCSVLIVILETDHFESHATYQVTMIITHALVSVLRCDILLFA